MLKGVGGGLKGEEERVTVGHRVVYPVRDHEEWPQLVRVAEGGIFVAQGFVVRDRTRGVTSPIRSKQRGHWRVVAGRKGWLLPDASGPPASGKEASEADGARNPAEEDSR